MAGLYFWTRAAGIAAEAAAAAAAAAAAELGGADAAGAGETAGDADEMWCCALGV